MLQALTIKVGLAFDVSTIDPVGANNVYTPKSRRRLIWNFIHSYDGETDGTQRDRSIIVHAKLEEDSLNG